MKVRASFRSQLVIGSVLWTLGLLVAISILTVHLLGRNPVPHFQIYQWFASAHVGMVVAAGAIAMSAGVWQIRRSLKAMAQLHTRLTAVHRGEARVQERHRLQAAADLPHAGRHGEAGSSQHGAQMRAGEQLVHVEVRSGVAGEQVHRQDADGEQQPECPQHRADDELRPERGAGFHAPIR